ncbi:Mur ligase family protein [Campylobacter sp. US33a]|uniref:Mur ligase family protein n=1 Tax=Campylobacter sp. US33a TaxID=2498120 RepID=UPI001068CA84|nr:Mur ligase family protein [Campylobacter sp. US33a]TEY04582.1 bifunctional folylpolyglutamate synthase/dihydrofolate synthase [Campylobacter sp. US33a]
MIISDYKAFLNSKSMNYQKIDYFMMFRMYEKYKNHLSLKPIIQIIGTNGKGSTGRFLAQMLCESGFDVGHYTSPHIFSFNERFWRNYKLESDEKLNIAHQKLQEIFKQDLEKLSYFEYATFLAAMLFKDCDFVIFEAGLGGEYDATSVFLKQMSIVTKIGFDHMQILGNTLTSIARTKLKVLAKETICSYEQEKEVLEKLTKITLLKDINLHIMQKECDENLKLAIKTYSQKYYLPSFLEHNLSLASVAFSVLLNSKEKILNILKILPQLDLRGRCEEITPNLFIDVGHNELAAKAIKERFLGQKLILVYNSFLDKDVFAVLKTLKPIIDKIQIYEYESTDRKLATEQIKQISNELNISCEKFTFFDEKNKYLVFGSFVLVENFLKEYFAKK